MAIGSSDLSLLFRLKAENQASPAIKSTQADIARLRQTFGSEFGQMQGAATRSLGAVTQSLTQVTGNIPILGTAVNGLAGHLGSLTTASTGAAGGLAAMTGPAAIAVAGIAATTTAVIALGTQLFNLAKSSAEFQGKLFDLSQQTGVAVETLSALEIVAQTTGGSIDSIAQSLVVFQGKLDDAQDSSSKAGKQFAALGITTADTESALREALEVLAKMPAGFEQTNTAAELFGRRGGKQLLAILKETNGDLDGAIKRFRDLGILISDTDARAADEFNDQLALLNFQLRAVGATIGKEIVPVALEAIKDLSTALKDNKDAINAVATAAGLLSNLFTGPLKGAIILIQENWERLRPALEVTAELYERIAHAARLISGRADFAGSGIGATGAGLGGIPEVGVEAGFKLPGLKSGLFKKALEESQAAAQQELELQRHLTEQLRLEHEKRGGDLQNFYLQQQVLIDERLVTLTGQLARERRAVLDAFERGEIDQAEANKRRADLDLRSLQAKNKADEDTRKLSLERDRAFLNEELRLREGIIKIEEARRSGELRRLEIDLERGRTVESEVLTRRLDFLKISHKERVGLIDFELKAETTSAERKEELNQQKKISEQQYTDEFKRLTRERIEALAAEAAAGQPGITGVARGGIGEDALGAIAGAAANVEAGVPPWMPDMTDAFGSLGEAMANTLGLGREFGQFFGDTLTNTFSSLAHAVGDAVHAFVLFGGAGVGVKKFAATVIAEIARMAAIQAIWELAQGFAMLALNFFWPDPKLAASATAHFHAAAIYGGMAAIAAGAGRAVAGGAFQEAGGGGASTGAGNQGRNPSDRSTGGPPAVVDADRRKLGEAMIIQPQVHVTITGEATESFTYRVETAAVESVRLNGPMRKIQKGEDV